MYAKVSDGTSEGISIEQMNELSAELQEVIDSMMDDNIWEATEILYEQTGDAVHVEAYKTNSPNGAYLKKANKLLK